MNVLYREWIQFYGQIRPPDGLEGFGNCRKLVIRLESEVHLEYQAIDSPVWDELSNYTSFAPVLNVNNSALLECHTGNPKDLFWFMSVIACNSTVENCNGGGDCHEVTSNFPPSHATRGGYVCTTLTLGPFLSFGTIVGLSGLSPDGLCWRNTDLSPEFASLNKFSTPAGEYLRRIDVPLQEYLRNTLSGRNCIKGHCFRSIISSNE